MQKAPIRTIPEILAKLRFYQNSLSDLIATARLLSETDNQKGRAL